MSTSNKMTSNSVLNKIIIPAILVLFVLLIVLYGHISSLYRDNFKAQVAAKAQVEQLKLARFWSGYGQLAKQFIHSPHNIQWFSQHTERGKDVSDDPNYRLINQSMNTLSEQDPSIWSAFFATEQTGEYFYNDRIVGEKDNYFTYKRPWYKEDVKRQSVGLVRTTVDYTTGRVSSVISGVVRGPEGKLLGVAGLDIKWQALAGQLNQNENELTLIVSDDNKLVMASPGSVLQHIKITTPPIDYDGNPSKESQKSELTAAKIHHPLKDFDSDAKTTGFADWVAKKREQPAGYVEVTYAGDNYALSYLPLSLELPEVQWAIAYLTPLKPLKQQILSLQIKLVLFGLFFALMLLVMFGFYAKSSKSKTV